MKKNKTFKFKGKQPLTLLGNNGVGGDFGGDGDCGSYSDCGEGSDGGGGGGGGLRREGKGKGNE